MEFLNPRKESRILPKNRSDRMTLWKGILFHKRGKKSRIRRGDDGISKRLGIDCGDKSVLGKRKTRQSRVESSNNKVRKKQKAVGNNGVDDQNGEIDRISQLPESIIHHIFTFLRCGKDMARMAVLSKNFKSMFNSYHSFDFDQRWFGVRGAKGKHNRIKARELQKRKFESYVQKSIVTRLLPLASIDKFRLYANKVDRSLAVNIVNWIHAATKKNVKELDIQVHREGIFMLPNDVLVSTSLTSLKLSGSILYDFTVIKLCNLRELSIKDTTILSQYMMKKFEDGCPLLEDLRLVKCPDLSQLVISSLVKLRRVEVQDCATLSRIEIASPKLESFWYHSKKKKQCKIDLKDSGNLKNLTLKDKMMTDSAFEDCIFKCPLLEKLVLHECNRLEKLKIFNGKLKSLALLQCSKLSEADIDAPNLYSFEYSGHMIPFDSMNAPHLHEVKLSFCCTMKKPQTQYISGNQDIFDNFDGSKGFKYIAYSKETMQIFEVPSEAPQNKFLKLQVTASSPTVLKTVDNWLRECHGKSLVVVSSNSELTKLINTMIIDREEHPSCCRFYSNKCWRHYIADVKLLEGGEGTSYDFTWRSRTSCAYKGQKILA